MQIQQHSCQGGGTTLLFIHHKAQKKRQNLIEVLSSQYPHRAESEGFEPPEPCSSTVFKTAAIDHSANFPPQK